MPTVPQRWRTLTNTAIKWLDPPWRHKRTPERRAWAWASLASGLTCYLFAFLYIGPTAGPIVTALYALPCVIAGWAFGASGGLLVALLTMPVHAWLYATGVIPADTAGTFPVMLGLASALVVGVSVGAARDLREQFSERTSELTASEDRYRQLVDNSPEGVLVHERGVVVFANPSMARLAGAANAEALLGRTLVNLAPFEDREALARALVDGRARCTVDARLAPPHGPSLAVQMTSMPIDYRGKRASLVLVREQALMEATTLIRPTHLVKA